MTITRKIKRIVLLKRDETDSNNNGGSDGNNTTQQRGRSGSATSTPDLTPLIISASSSTSSIQDSSSPMSAPTHHHSLNSPAVDYALVKTTKVSSIPLKSNSISSSSSGSVDEHNMFRPFISKTPRGALQSTPGSSSISSSPNISSDDSCIIETHSQTKECVPSRSNTVIGGRVPLEKIASAVTPVADEEEMNKQDNSEPKLKKTRSASIITVKKKVVIYTQPQKSEIIAPPVLENAAKFSLIQAVNNEEERLQKLKVEEVEESPLDEESTRSSFSNGNMASPVNVYSPRAFENGLHLTPTKSRPSLDEISGNPSKLFAFMEDGEPLKRSVSPRRSTIDEHRRSTITKSDDVGEDLNNNGIELAIPTELENVGNYGPVSLEKLIQERNKKYRGSIRGIHSLSQKPSSSTIGEENQEEKSSKQPNVQISHQVCETDSECSKITTYQLSNCCNIQSSLDQSISPLESFYPLPEGSLTFEIKSQANQEKQLRISFKAKRSINMDLHKIMMEIITQDNSNQKIHQLEDYEWSMVMETSSDIPTSKELLKRIISENQKDTSQGFQFKSFSHLSNFIGNSVQEEMKRRLPHSSSLPFNGENLKMALVFTQNDFIPSNYSALEQHDTIQELLKNEKVDFNFTNCLETHFGKEIVFCSSKIMFLCVQFYSPLLDSDIQFKLPLLPNNITENSKREQVVQCLEEQVSQLGSELEELLYQKYMWEFLMKYTFKVFDSRIMDSTKLSIMNQKRTLKYIGEKSNIWTSCVCRCPITPGRFVDANLGSNVPGDLSSLKTNHVLTLRLDSFPIGSDIYIGIINANHTAEQILQNYVVSGRSDSHTFFLKDRQFRHGSLIVNSISNNADSEYSFSEGDILQVVLNYSNMNIHVYRNYNQRILPSFAPNAIDLENSEWYFVVGLSQNGQQITLI